MYQKWSWAQSELPHAAASWVSNAEVPLWDQLFPKVHSLRQEVAASHEKLDHALKSYSQVADKDAKNCGGAPCGVGYLDTVWCRGWLVPCDNTTRIFMAEKYQPFKGPWIPLGQWLMVNGCQWLIISIYIHIDGEHAWIEYSTINWLNQRRTMICNDTRRCPLAIVASISHLTMVYCNC